MADYINELKHLSNKCKFGDNLNERLRDKIVSGLNNDKMVRKLLDQGDGLTFNKACNICLQMEQGEKDTQKLLQGEIVHKVNTYQGSNNTKHENRTPIQCYRCLKTNHKAENCYFKDKVCNFCKKIGHIDIACRNRQSNIDSQTQIKNNRPKYGNNKEFKKIKQIEQNKLDKENENN